MRTSRRNFLIGAAVGQVGVAQAAAQGPGRALPATAAGEALSARDFGARGDGGTDDHAALTAAVTAAARSFRPLILPTGVYHHSRPLELGFAGLRIRGEGLVTLRHTGAGPACVTIDAGERAVRYDHVLENIVIEGSGAPNQDGLFVRNMPHGIRRNIRVRNVTGRAFHILGDVLSTWENCIVSTNETSFRQFPARAFHIGASPAVSATTAVVFINCIAEGATEYGWYLDRCDASKWVGGSSEGNRAIGLFIGRDATQNSFDSFFMEQNGRGDLVVEGHGNHFANCLMQSRAAASPFESVPAITVRPGARGNRFEGGGGYFATVEPGALNTSFRHMELRHSIDDRGTGTVIADCLQLFVSGDRLPSRTFGNVEDHNPRALDWYQELEFEPTLQGARSAGRLSYRRRAGAGTRIGNMVFFSIELELSGVQQAPAGAVTISGLPFAANAAIGAAVTIGDFTNIVSGAPVTAQLDAGQRTIRLNGVEGSALAPGSVLRLSGHYRV